MKLGFYGWSMLGCLIIASVAEESLLAFEQPNVNLGASSFFDGMAAVQDNQADAGFYFNQYAQYYHADRFNNGSGRAIPGAPNLDAYTSLTQLIYLMDRLKILGARVGIDALIPVTELRTSAGSGFLSANPGHLGDLTAGAALQWDLVSYHDHPLFMHRLDFDVMVPTGSYDRKFAINPGANTLSFNPYWAGTLLLGSDVVASWRVHYLWNGENEEPSLAVYPPWTRTVQAGQAYHLNFDLAYNLYAHRLYAGVNGYYLQQLTDTRLNGISVPSLREQVLALGPGIVFNLDHNTHFCLNSYIEMAVENRPSGFRLNILFAFHF